MPHRSHPLRLAARLFGPPALPQRSAPADALTDQAARWADHVLATPAGDGPALPAAYVTRKALDAVAFSLRHGLREIHVPSKLVGVAAHQPTVEALAPYAVLPAPDRPRLVVAGDLSVHVLRSDRSLHPIGRVQPKHAAWLAPLLGHGVALHLHAVTGLDRRARGLPVTLGVNVRVSGFALALASLALARQRAERSAPHLTLVQTGHVAEAPARYQAGGGGERPPAAVRMTRPHAARHSPSGPEWEYSGSGPADGARSVLLALTDPATADAHYQAFKDEVVARVPEAGDVLQHDLVLAWLGNRVPLDRAA